MEFCACCTRSIVADESGDFESWRVGCFGGAMTCALGASSQEYWLRRQEYFSRTLKDSD